jgi:hypothetical protein
MKVHVSSKFSKKLEKIKIFKHGRLNTSKYRGKFQKMGVLCIHSPKMLGPSPNFQKRKLKKIKKLQKKRRPAVCETTGRGQQVTAGSPPAPGLRLLIED